jgi:hypothetical protein
VDKAAAHRLSSPRSEGKSAGAKRRVDGAPPQAAWRRSVSPSAA